MLYGTKYLQRLQVFVHSLRRRVLSDAMVWSIEQFHASKGMYLILHLWWWCCFFNYLNLKILYNRDQKDSLKMDTFDVKNQLNVINLTQIDKDSILLCHDNFVKIIGLDGIVKMDVSGHKPMILEFNFRIDSLVCLPEQESVIAFHKHGLEERSIKENDVSDNIIQKSSS